MSSKFLFVFWTSCISSLAAFFAPLWTLVLWACCFVLGDLITGMWAARKKCEMWTSSRLRSTVAKTTLYFTFIVFSHAIDGMLPLDRIQLAKIVSCIICTIELYSMLENAYKITDHRVFYLLTQFTSKKLKDMSGLEIPEKEKEK